MTRLLPGAVVAFRSAPLQWLLVVRAEGSVWQMVTAIDCDTFEQVSVDERALVEVADGEQAQKARARAVEHLFENRDYRRTASARRGAA